MHPYPIRSKESVALDSYLILQDLGISLLLGLLVGLQREHAGEGRPGLRTFPLITIFGTVAAVLSVEFGGWIVAAGLICLVATSTFPHLIILREENPDKGTTTDMAVLVMYCVGAMLVVAPMEVAVVVGGGVAVLLQFKPELHSFVERLGNEDLKAIMQFVLITCIILPVLPNDTYGPLGVFNPRETWLMVVLIVGMSLGGYIVYKFFGRDAGILLGGILGGAISSTATTVTQARQAHGGGTGSRAAAIVVMVASTVLFVRVLVEISVVAPAFLPSAGPPVVVLMLLTMIPAFVAWYRVRQEPSQMPEQENPTQLKSALLFGGMYALVLFALTWAKEYVGTEAMYAFAALSGLTDMDAITLAMARMSKTDPAILDDGWRFIIVGAISNLAFKAGLVGVLGNRRLLGQILILFSIPAVGGIMLILLWP